MKILRLNCYKELNPCILPSFSFCLPFLPKVSPFEAPSLLSDLASFSALKTSLVSKPLQLFLNWTESSRDNL